MWKTLSATPKMSGAESVRNSRLTANDDLKRFGVTHLAIASHDFIAEDLRKNQVAWGLSLAGEVGGVRLYKLE